MNRKETEKKLRRKAKAKATKLIDQLPAGGKRLLRLMLVPNEDGFGPTLAVLRLLKGLLEVARERGLALDIRLLGGKQKLLAHWIEQELQAFDPSITSIPVPGVIQLVKEPRGLLDIQATRQALVGSDGGAGYLEKRNSYASRVSPALEQVHAVISFGSPEILYAAANVARQQGKAIRRFEFFDHSWALTYENIFNSEEYRGEYRRHFGKFLDEDDEAKRVLGAIAKDEAQAERVWLFPEFMTSSDYYCHWMGVMEGRPVERIQGVLGGIDRDKKREAWMSARRELAQKLRLDPAIVDTARIVVVQAGGTQLWDEFLGLLLFHLNHMDAAGRLGDIFLFQKYSLVELLKKLRKQDDPEMQPIREAISAILAETPKRIRSIGDETYVNWQRVYVGADLIFSRAGGITVQDAVACLTPIVCVEETGQWQTEKIRKTCERHRISKTVFHGAFKGAAIGPIITNLNEHYPQDAHLGTDQPRTPKPTLELWMMTRYPSRWEKQLAAEILDCLLEQST